MPSSKPVVLCLLVLIFLKGNHFILFIICIFHTPTRLCHKCNSAINMHTVVAETGNRRGSYYSFKIIRIRILELLLKIGQNFSFSKTNFCLLLPISRPHILWFMLYANNICGNFQVQFITVLLKHSSNNI